MPRTSTATNKKSTSKQTVANQKSGNSHPTVPRKKLGEGEDRQQMIAVAAYFRAERRGFNGGDPVTDWLDAENEINEMLKMDESFNVH